MIFKEFSKKIREHFNEMAEGSKRLFEVEFDYEEMKNLYLNSYPEGSNEIYRKRREFDCSSCEKFIRDIGNVVAIKNGQLHTIWEPDIEDGVYSVVAKALDWYIREKKVKGVYLRKAERIGTPVNRKIFPSGEIEQYSHLFVELPEICKYTGTGTSSFEREKAAFRDTRNVFKRSLDEIDSEAIEIVLELISQNSLYKGAEWKNALQELKTYKKEYDQLQSEREKELWSWEKSIDAGMTVGRIRNRSMGTLLVDLSEGMDLDLAVKKYEQIVAPANYKRPKAIFTKKMLEDAKKTITELGYMDALQRRFATLDDITVNNILFSNKDAAKRISGADDLFGEMEKDVAINPKKFSKIEEISVRDFINNVLPTAKTDNDPKDMWGLRTNQFVPVSVMCYSPNYWDEQQGIGHQHLFFMLKDCVNPEEPNGYYNEFLKPELEQHRRVFEALGAKAHVKDTDDQLSGVGFSLTRRNDLVVKVKGATERVLRVKF